MAETIIVIPTYDERENIGCLLEALRALPLQADVLVVDDNSPDGTAQVVRAYQKKHPTWGLFLLCREKPMGLGAAYRHAFRHVLDKAYTYVVQMDADFSHNPQDVPRLLRACQQGEGMVVGSRYVKGVNVVNWPISRVLLSYVANRYIQWVTGMGIRDATSGFVCYHREALQRVVQRKSSLAAGGYAFQIEAKFAVWRHQFPARELSIIFTDRIRGKSKISHKIFWEAFFAVIALRVGDFFAKYPPAA